MPINQTEPTVPGVDTGPNSTVMIVHPTVLVDTSDNALGVAVNPLYSSTSDLSVSGTITAAQSTQQTPIAGGTVVLSLGAGQGSWKAEIVALSTFTSATTIVVDGSVDGTNWIAKGIKVGGSLTSTSVQSIVGPGPLELGGNCAGLTKIRVRASVLGSTETLTVTLNASAATGDISLLSSLPAGSNLVGGVTVVDSAGTNKAMIDAAGSQAVRGNFTEQTGLSAASLNADLVPSTDVSAYKWLSIHISSSAYSGTLTFQGSNDGAAFVNVLMTNVTSGSLLSTTTNTVSVIYERAVTFRYFRVRMTAYTSGTANATLELYTSSSAPGGMQSAQAGTWTVQPGNTQNTNPWLTAGATANAAQAANTAGNVVVKGTPGYLWSAVVTTTGTAQLDIYDNATTNSGTKLLSIPANATVGSIYSIGGGGRASVGIVSNGVANCPGVTFYYS